MLSCLFKRNNVPKVESDKSPMVQSSDVISTDDTNGSAVTKIDTNNLETEHKVQNEEITLQYADTTKASSEEKSDEYDNRRAGIFPDPNHIETTLAKSKRTKEMVQHVVHDVDWSGVFDESLVPNATKWKFRSKSAKKVERGTDAWTIEILSPSECEKLISLCELYGFVDVGYPVRYRSNTRMITNDQSFADLLYQRIKECCPQTYKHDGTIWKICGLNGTFTAL